MQMYNILDKLKQLAESDPHYQAAAESAVKYAPVIPEGVEGEKCVECGLYESHCECPSEKNEAKKEKVAEAELNSLTRHAGIARLHTQTMSTHVDTIVESINHTKAILSEGAISEGVMEAGYSAKAARQGKDIGKPGKQFAKIAKSAGERYGSKERGEKVAGAVLAKLRAKHESVEEGHELTSGKFSPETFANQPSINRLRALSGQKVEENFADTPGDDEMGRLDTNIAVGEDTLNEKEFSSKDEFDKFAKTGDTYKTERGTVEKTLTGIKHTAKAEEEDEEDDDTPKKKGAPKKKESEKTSASLPKFDQVSKLEKNLPKHLKKTDPKHKSKTKSWGMKDHKKFESLVRESIEFAESMSGVEQMPSYPGWKRACRESYPGCTFEGTADMCECVYEGAVMEKFASQAQARLMHATAGGADTGVSPAVAKEYIKKSHGQKVGDLPEKVKEDDMEEGNKFSGELARAKAAGAKEFEVDGKEYPVKEGEDMEEGNEFTGALAQAKKEGESSFKVGGKTFQVTREGNGEDLFRIAELAGMKPEKVKEEAVEESETQEPVSAMSDKDLADYIGSTEAEVKADREAAEEAAEEKSQDYAKDSVEESKEEICETCECEPCKCEDSKEEKVEEGTAEPAKEGSSGGMFGKGIYEAYNTRVEDVINENLTINTTQSTEGEDTISVTATGEEAHALVDILRNAGLGHSNAYKQYTADAEAADQAEGQVQVIGLVGPQGQAEAEAEEQEELDEWANSPYGHTDERGEVADTEELVVKDSGGLNGPKKQYDKGYAGDNPAGTNLKGYIQQQTTLAEESLVNLTKDLWKQYKG